MPGLFLFFLSKLLQKCRHIFWKLSFKIEKFFLLHL